MIIRPTPSGRDIALDLTPVIDMVFLLLIFFLVATTFQQTEREMKIALPTASAAGPISAALRELVVNVDEQGQMIVNSRVIEPEALREVVEQAVAANPEQKVSVRGDRTTAYANIVRVLDICKGAGVPEPYLDTVMIDPGS
jgi:biopolymer transport protein ExbD